MIYPFVCEECGMRVELKRSAKEYDTMARPVCHGEMEQEIVPFGVAFRYTPGKETGIYKLDYGKGATWDLTPKGKYERLVKDGTVPSPNFGNVRRGDSEESKKSYS